MSGLANVWFLLRSVALAAVTFVGRLLLVLVAVVPCAVTRALAGRRRPHPLPNPGARRPRILFIGGTINHTTQVQQIAAELPECEHAFTWYYCDGVLDLFRRLGALESTAAGGKLRARCLAHLEAHGLPLDLGGQNGPYD